MIGKTIRQIEEEQDVDFKVSAWYREIVHAIVRLAARKPRQGDVLVIRTSLG